MPIKIPNDLPARTTLEREGVMVMTEEDAIRQDIRPLRIALLNLMPNKVRTETQFARLIGATPLQVEMSLIRMSDAALHHFHGVPKHALPRKAFGVFRHRNLKPASPYLRGFSDDFSIPVSRWTEVRLSDLPRNRGLEVLMESDETGLCLVEDPAHRMLYMFNHIEYDTTSLAEEYWRDIEAGRDIQIPANYFPGNDPHATPENRWRSHAHLLFGNWINEVYQTTPFELEKIGTGEA